MKKLENKISDSTIDELVQLYYSLNNHVKSGDLPFQQRMDRAGELIDKSISEGVYFYRRTLYNSSPRSIAFNLEYGQKQKMLNLASNDYLNFSQNPQVIEEGIIATRKYGIGTGSVPMLSGTLNIHRQLEERLATFLGYEVSLYQAW